MDNLTTLKNYSYSGEKIFEKAQDFLPINGTDYVEFYVGNAKQSAHYYKTAFGFQELAYCGLETGVRDRTSYVLQQGKILIILTTPLVEESDVARHIAKHGDGIRVIALWVDDAYDAFEQTVLRGAKPFLQPETLEDENGTVRRSGIHTYGDTVHIFIERKDYNGIFLPGFEKWETEYRPSPMGLKYIDHMVGNVELGKMNEWSDFYQNVMGFANLITFDDKDISTEYTALMSKVMTNGNGYIKFPLNEPAKGKKKSQIEEFLDFYNGPGCQHLAVATDDIVYTVSEMRKKGVEFLYVPGTYYDSVKERVGIIEEDLEILKKWGIMVDRDEDGYLLQIFSKNIIEIAELVQLICQFLRAQQ
ncbi:MAG TPA: 4-hydroxyphenylpyruvate dioxygenase, partial [Saprospiraceae bacterium]|nr:4-hydroxyphenylpyruvate dioxygenase [Saprospiraceae bacterium]